MSFVLHRLVERHPETWEQYQERKRMEKEVRTAVNRAVRCIPKETLKRVRAAFRGQ